jgi:hypothetical protein
MQSHLITAPDWPGTVDRPFLVALANVAFELWKERLPLLITTQL